MKRHFLAALVAAASAGCGTLIHQRVGGPELAPRPGAAPGGALYQVGRLAFEAPATWAARGDALRVAAVHPAEQGRIEVQQVEGAFADEADCLARAAETLQRGAAGAVNVRQHPTTFAGRKGVALEGDQGPWHGWAWAVCDGGTQYRVSFFALSPPSEEVMAAWSGLTRSARLEP
jgi:hypothetical protein